MVLQLWQKKTVRSRGKVTTCESQHGELRQEKSKFITKRMKGKPDKICKGEAGAIHSTMRKMLSIVVVVHLDVDDVESVTTHTVDTKSHVCKGNCMQAPLFGFDSKALTA